MDAPSQPRDAEADSPNEVDGADRAHVSTHRTNPDRTVFIEEDNSNGWIATDLTVPLGR